MTTTNALLSLTRNVYDELDRGNYIFSIFVDFRKAFDVVCHNILLSKLHHYGVRGDAYRFIASYLSNRRQFVRLGTSVSSTRVITHGVPQGSILGPLLFLVFINDLTLASQLFRCILYADDCTLSYAFPKSQSASVHNTLNEGLSDVSDWLLSSRLAVNTEKTKFIVFTCRGSVTISPVLLGTNVIQQVQYTKFLGLIIDQNLTFSHHINYLSTKISKTVGIMYRINSFLPNNILKTIYYSLLHPYLIYGCEVYLGTSRCHIDRLVVLQKKAIRAISNLGCSDHTSSYFGSLKILKLLDLHKYHVCIYIFKTMHFNFDSSLLSVLNSRSSIHSHLTRNSSNLSLPLYSLSKSQYSIVYVGIKFWNSLPSNVMSSNSVQSFKSKLKLSLIESYSTVV